MRWLLLIKLSALKTLSIKVPALLSAVTILEVLANARARLAAAAIDDPEIEAEILLRHALASPDRVTLGRSAFYLHLLDPITPEQQIRFEELLARRLAREPTAYILGEREFYGLRFEVSPAVLIPRPETEHLVDVAIRCAASSLTDGRGPAIVDVGTGSGAIAVTLATKFSRAEIYAVDVSEEALVVARSNARQQGVAGRISFRRGDMLGPIDTYVDLVVANLPYVSTADWQALPAELRDNEPRRALDGGEDGLRLIERLLRQAPAYLKPHGSICLEFGDGQAPELLALARKYLRDMSFRIESDLAGIERIFIARSVIGSGLLGPT